MNVPFTRSIAIIRPMFKISQTTLINQMTPYLLVGGQPPKLEKMIVAHSYNRKQASQKEDACFLWSEKGQPLDSIRLDIVLPREFKIHLSTTVNLPAWYHLAVAISRRYIRDRYFKKTTIPTQVITLYTLGPSMPKEYRKCRNMGH